MFNFLITDLTKKINSNYFVKEKLESGIVLLPYEVKSIRFYGCSIVNSFAYIDKLEIWIKNLNINIPSFINNFGLSKDRKKKLLLNKKQILYCLHFLNFSGTSFIPSKIYWKKNFIKVELCICKGKKLIDKKNDLKYAHLDK